MHIKKHLVSTTFILASTLAGAEVVSAADSDVNVYGRVRLVLDMNDTDDQDKKLDVANGSSRFGVKGTEKLDDGLSSFYQAEFEYNAADGFNLSDDGNDFRLRLGFAGLKGNWGSLQIGQDLSPMYSLVLAKVDDAQSYFGYGIGRSSGSAFRQGNMVKYKYNSGGYSDNNGVAFQMALIADGSDSTFTEYQPGIAYKAGDLYIGAVYRMQRPNEPDADKDTLALAAAYKPTPNSYVAVDYIDYSDKADSNKDESSYDITGTVGVGEGLFLTGVYGATKSDDNVRDFDNVVVQLMKKFSSRTMIWGAATSASDNANDIDTTAYQVGIRRNFD